jgi:lipid A 3-O-deacylase
MTSNANKAMAEEYKDTIVIGAGAFDITDDDTAAEFRLEYRFGHRYFDLISPMIGGMVTSDSSAYGYVGMRIDFQASENVFISPSFAAGAYEEGDGKDLGNTLEFRSELEISYRFSGDMRLGASFYHMSNASIGDKNPGAEGAMLVLIIPVN